MSFLLSQNAPTLNVRGANDIALLHKLECRACPLNKTAMGKMAPTGAERPLVYILGEGPGATEVELREQFVGDSGQILRSRIPRHLRDKIRFNNVVRSRPPGNATPEFAEIECCRPSVVKDVERSKPKAIFGFGNVPLEWVSGFSGVTLWRGRRMPVKVGSHTCWFYPMLHPTYLLHSRRKGNVSEEEQIFGLDMKRAFAEVEVGLPTPVVHSAEDVHRNVEIILEGGAAGLAKVKAALAWAAKLPVVGMDYETNGLRPYEAGSKILTGAVANGDRAIAFPIDHPEARWNKAEREDLLHIWGRFIREARGVKAVHNAAFEMEWTAVKIEEDLIRAGKWECTQAQACILDERKGKKKAGPLSLEFLVQQYFGFNLKKLAGVDRKNLEETPLEAVLLYNAPDARYHCLLWEQQNIRIEEEGLREAATLAQRRVPTCVLSQIRGLIVDQTEVQRLQKKYEKAIDKTLVEIAALPVIQEFKRKKGKDFKPLSNPDVLYVFRDLLHRNEVLVKNKFTKKREYSADESVLERIDHPLAELLLSLRHYNKRKATYIDPLDAEHEESVIFSDSLIHAQINTTFSEAGRLSIESPSLQNFPKRDNEAKEVRKQIVAAPNCVLLAFDFGQIEARILAAFTQDKSFCKALWERYDVHQEWAERLAYAYPRRVGGKQNLKDKKAMKAFRTDVKNQWTFPLFYGAKLESAAEYLDIPVDTIRPLYNAFWKQFAGVKAWQEKQVERYNELGYTECLTGRRRHGPLSLNQILNSPVQGSAAEMVMLAMSRLSETGDPDLQPEINIHDDLTFARVDEKRVDDVAEKILDIMLDPKVFSWINFPVVVEGSIGMNWLEMEEFGVFSSDDWYK